MRSTEHRCDRCGKTLDHGGETRLGVVIEVQYHHPQSLDLCVDCEAEFTLWLGRHPLFGTPLADILNGGCIGGGYPTQEQIEAFKARKAAR